MKLRSNLVIIREIAAHSSGARNDNVTAFNAFELVKNI